LVLFEGKLEIIILLRNCTKHRAVSEKHSKKKLLVIFKLPPCHECEDQRDHHVVDPPTYHVNLEKKIQGI
jgi:hypothetical protein